MRDTGESSVPRRMRSVVMAAAVRATQASIHQTGSQTKIPYQRPVRRRGPRWRPCGHRRMAGQSQTSCGPPLPRVASARSAIARRSSVRPPYMTQVVIFPMIELSRSHRAPPEESHHACRSPALDPPAAARPPPVDRARVGRPNGGFGAHRPPRYGGTERGRRADLCPARRGRRMDPAGRVSHAPDRPQRGRGPGRSSWRRRPAS